MSDVYARFGRPLRPELPVVAYLTNQLPFPAHSGGQVREAQLLTRLSERFNICLGALTAEFARDVEFIDESLELFCEVVLAPAQDLGSGSGHRRLVDNHAFTAAWAQRVHAADLVHVEGYFLMHHLPADAPPIVLVAENIEYALHRDREPNGEWERTRDAEVAAWRRAAICGTVSDADLIAMRKAAPDVPSVLVANGWDHLADVLVEPDDINVAQGAPTLVYTGNYGWGPTSDGAHHLLEDIWPIVRAQHPTVRLVLAGIGPTPRMLQLATADERVVVTGRLPSLVGVLRGATVFVCPPRYSGGIEVKLVEALFAGCAVVSSAHSVHGLPDDCKPAVVAADTSARIADACLRLLADPELRREHGELALKAAAAMPSWDAGAAALEEAWRKVGNA